MMGGAEELRARILERLSTVIDPETGVDVIRMRLVEDLVVDEHDKVSYKFRPSSALCPLAVPLAQAIQGAVAEVSGVADQELQVVGYILADELTALIKQAFAAPSE
jgi:metal-sulfur cluster biosynthetic enzyme